MSNIELELHVFMDSIESETIHLMRISRYEPFVHKFAAMLGFRRHHGSCIRPNIDPKYTPFRWTIDELGFVKNVRVAGHKLFYAACLLELAKKKNATLPNGWNLAELLEILFRMNNYLTDDIMVKSTTNAAQIAHARSRILVKYMLNSFYTIISQHGNYSGIGMGTHTVNELGREKMTKLVNLIIDSGGTVLAVNTDFVVYSGDHIGIDTVHHQTYEHALFFGKTGTVVCGNNLMVASVPRILVSMEGFVAGSVGPTSTLVDARDRAEKRCSKHKQKFASELKEYMSQDLASVTAKLQLDNECLDL